MPSRNPRVATSSGASVCNRNSSAAGPVDRCLFIEFIDQPEVVLDDVEHADSFLQGPASELVADGQAVLVARVQVGLQRSDVLGVKVVGVGHVEVPR